MNGTTVPSSIGFGGVTGKGAKGRENSRNYGEARIETKRGRREKQTKK